MNFKSIILNLILLFSVIYFTGCAHAIVHNINKIEEQREDIDKKRKIYRSANKTFSPETISEIIKADSTFNPDKKMAEEEFPVILNLLHIDDSKYPDEIKLKAIVTDTAGNYVKGLAEPYFKGSGSPQDYWIELNDSCKSEKSKIQNFTVKEIRQDIAEPFAIHFILDHSPSMTHQKALYLQKVIKSVLYAVKSNDLVAVTKFTKKMTKEIDFKDSKSVYNDKFKIDGLDGHYGDGTAYFDALKEAIYSFEEVPDSFRKVIISFSDGEDNSSDSDANEIKLLSKEKDVQIYSVAYGYANEISKEIAEYSGGRYYFILSSKEFPYVFRDIYLLLNNYYEITYNPPDCNDIHQINMGLTFPDINMEILTDTGYYDRSVFTPNDPVGTKAIVNIEFDYNSSEIKKESYVEIGHIANLMIRNPELNLLITGHTDSDGDEDYNMKLSLERASSVRDMLVDLGINKNRLKIAGKGESEPLLPNDTELHKRKNRRTEFEIIK
jgi:hypothetical protein